MTNDKKIKYDLEERTAKFGEDIIETCKKVARSPITDQIVAQLVACGTSVGANYCEADCAESRKDFEHKIGICKKESRESKHFFRMLAKAVPELANEARILWKEANELNLIFTTIVIKSRKNNNR